MIKLSEPIEDVRPNTASATNTELTRDDAIPRILDEKETDLLLQKVLSFAKPGGMSIARLDCWWNGELRWARNRVNLASDRRDVRLSIIRSVHDLNGFASVSTNQFDDVSLKAAMHAAERSAAFVGSQQRAVHEHVVYAPELPIPEPSLWSEATYNVTAEQRGAIARQLADQSELQQMSSAGYLEMRAGASAILDKSQLSGWPLKGHYTQYTVAQCSMTVRHPKGIGSGWAGSSNYDWSTIQGRTLSEQALKKCLNSLNPVAIEPGRYTVVLEPQAVCDLLEWLFLGSTGFDRDQPELNRNGPWFLGEDQALKLLRSKLGLKIVDERVTISRNIMDPQLGGLPAPGAAPVTWIHKGMLTALEQNRSVALKDKNDNNGVIPGAEVGFRMSGGTTSIDEMIQSTKRGLLVTRFSNIRVLDGNSMLLNGVTRDGLWLIENGKISKAVKNMRFTESPLFMLNQLQDLGVPVPVFWRRGSGPTPAIVPPLKAADFSFTSMIDAI